MTNVNPPAAPPHNILIVDDEEIVLAALRENLRREGYQVVTAPNARVALETANRQLFAVIISDDQMPQMTGMEFLSQVKTIQPNATRILITAVLRLDTLLDAINNGEIYRLIVKPWLRGELLATVKNAVQRYESVGGNAALQAETQARNEQLRQLNHSLEMQLAHLAEQHRQLSGLNEALAGNLQHSVQLCLQVMETFYPTIGSQTRRVVEICTAMADNLELPADQRQTLDIGAWLHDIGLIRMPRDLFRRWREQPDTLSEPERALIEQHPVLGQQLAGLGHPPQTVGPVIRAPHERFDGSGYPDNLQDGQIPWLGRLLAVAVDYAASIASGQDALEAVELASGRAYDPQAVGALRRALAKAT